MRKWLLILLLAIPLIHAGLLLSPEPVDASGDVVLATGTVTLANTKLSLADGVAFFDFSTDMTPWIGETIEICPATAASKHYCIRGLVSTVGTGETYGSEKLSNPTVEVNISGWNHTTILPSLITDNRPGSSGTKAIKASYANNGYLYTSFSATSGALYIYDVWSKKIGGADLLVQYWYGGGVANIICQGLGSTGDWLESKQYCTNYSVSISGISVKQPANAANDMALDDISVKQVLTPSTTGHWVKKSAASTTDGDGWSQKSASFLANDSAGYYWRIIKSKADDIAIRKGTCTGTTQCRFSLVDGTAFIDGDGTIPLSNYVGHTLKVRDSSGYEIVGVIKAVGTGETLSPTELVTNGTFSDGDTGWTKGVGWTIADQGGGDYEAVATAVANDITIYGSTVRTAGRLYKGSITCSDYTSGGVKYTNNSQGVYGNSLTGMGTSTAYFTAILSYGNVGARAVGVSTLRVDDITDKQVLTPSTTGATIVSATGGTTYNWTSKNASFNPNQATAYTWEILGQSQGTVTSADVHLATVDAGAMVEISGVDLSQYAGVDAYTPPTANLQLHLKADSGCYTDAGKTTACSNDGDKAYVWADQSVNGNDAVQATEGYRPLYKTSIVGSLPAIRFDGTDDFLGLSSGLSMLKNVAGSSIYAVFKRSGSSPVNAAYVLHISNGANTSQSRHSISILPTTELIRSGGRRLDADSFQAQSLVQSSVATNYLVSSVMDYVGTKHSVNVNGMSRGYTSTFQTTGNTSDTDSLLISIGKYGDTGSFLNGDIYEILVYNTAHDDATRTRIERYLAGKWGITSYQPTYAATSPARYMLALYDSAGKVATGWIGGPGAGETLGGELVTNGTFDSNTSGWTPSWATLASVAGGYSNNCLEITRTGESTQRAYTASAISTSIGQLLRGSYYVKSGSAGNKLYNIYIYKSSSPYTEFYNAVGTTTGSWINTTFTKTNTVGALYADLIKYDATDGTMLFDEFSIKIITDISKTGVHLHSTPNAYDRKMARKDSGFNPNAVASYKIYQQ